MQYSAYETLVAPARAKSNLWRIAAGIILGLIMYFGIVLQYFSFVSSLFGDEVLTDGARDGTYATAPFGTVLILFSFISMIIAAGAAARILNGRTIDQIIGPAAFALRDFFRVCRAVLPFFTLLYAVAALAFDATLSMAPLTWLLLLPISLIAVLIQVSAEEFAFRGYLQAQIAARFASPIIWIAVPSALFAFLHYDPAEAGSNALLIALWAFCFGCFAADLTARTGTIGAAIALHFVNNVFALLIISISGSLSGLALMRYPFTIADTEAVAMLLPLDFGIMLCAWLLARIALRC